MAKDHLPELLFNFCRGKLPLAQYNYIIIYSNSKSINLAVLVVVVGKELEPWGRGAE